MHVAIRRNGLIGSPGEAARRARDHIVPLLRGWPGFRGHRAFVAPTGDAVYSVSVFDDREAAMDAHGRSGRGSPRAWAT
jgi:hypothetical protein